MPPVKAVKAADRQDDVLSGGEAPFGITPWARVLRDGRRVIAAWQIFSRWIISETHAREMMQRLLARFAYTPIYLPVTMTDDGMRIGDVASVQTRRIPNTEGGDKVLRWQVIEAQHVEPAERTQYLLQQFIYQASRYDVWMAADAPDVLDATPEGHEQGGMWWSNGDGRMPDGSPG